MHLCNIYSTFRIAISYLAHLRLVKEIQKNAHIIRSVVPLSLAKKLSVGVKLLTTFRGAIATILIVPSIVIFVFSSLAIAFHFGWNPTGMVNAMLRLAEKTQTNEKLHHLERDMPPRVEQNTSTKTGCGTSPSLPPTRDLMKFG